MVTNLMPAGMRIIFAAGGSCGHLFPAIEVTREIFKMERDIKILFLCSKKKKDGEILERENIPFEIMPQESFPRKISLKSIKFLVKLLQGFIASGSILKKSQPHVVVGFGGYVSFVPVIVASLKGIPTFIHEQNFLFGWANKVLLKWVDKAAISFLDTKKFIKNSALRRKLILTGNPIRQDLLNTQREEALKYFGFKDTKFTILVIGGSLGSHKINEKFLEAAGELKKKLESSLQIIHICGKEDLKDVNSRYKELNINAKVYSFLERIGYAYRVCDLVISRAGASVLTEIMANGKASILIPYPYARGHQRFNAEFLAQNGASWVVEEKDLSGKILRDLIFAFINNREKLNLMADKARELFLPSASQRIAQEILSLGEH